MTALAVALLLATVAVVVGVLLLLDFLDRGGF